VHAPNVGQASRRWQVYAALVATQVQFDVDVTDVEYQQLAGAARLARVYRPIGSGPFPTIVDVHGGAWNNGERTNDAALNRAMAERGLLTIAIDFRQPPEAGYPASVADVNLAIRWAKLRAHEYGGTSKVGAIGVSSGGHVVLLSGLRPRDPRYAALPLAGAADVDASLAYVIACWPVSDPLYRYREVAQKTNSASLIAAHDAYWGSEAAMSEGSPPLILERGEPVELPPALIIQRKVDDVHPLEMQQRLVDWYRRRGGLIDMPLYDSIPRPFVVSTEYPDSLAIMEAIGNFVARHG
jgi:acetyl esterase/lipase